MAYLVLVRHGESTWNEKGLWTGLTDVPLTEKGREEARVAAEKIKDIRIDIAYVSILKRAKETLFEMSKVLGLQNLPTFESPALNERDYGIYTGRNKWEVKREAGDEQFLKIRRSWDFPIPKGESLKDVYNRVVPYYINSILPNLKLGKSILVSAHGNSMRALAKYLENIPDQETPKLEMGTGEVWVYQINPDGKVVSKEIRATNPLREKQ